MAERKVKCQICIVMDTRDKMTQLPNKRFVHSEKCIEIHNENVEKKKEENRQWSDLYEYLKELHGLIEVPTRNIKRLHELRNGFDFVEGKRVQRYKQGADYGLMLEAYKLQEDKIRWFIKEVLDEGKDAADINKCISMMLNGLNTAWQSRQNRLKKQKEVEKEMSLAVPASVSLETSHTIFKRRKDELDISDLI